MYVFNGKQLSAHQQFAGTGTDTLGHSWAQSAASRPVAYPPPTNRLRSVRGPLCCKNCMLFPPGLTRMEQADPGVQDSFVWDFIAQLMPAKENPPSIPSVSVPHSVHLDSEFTRPKPWPLGSWMDHRYALYTWIKASVQLAWTTGVHYTPGSRL